jgi:hypothetical protein
MPSNFATSCTWTIWDTSLNVDPIYREFQVWTPSTHTKKNQILKQSNVNQHHLAICLPNCSVKSTTGRKQNTKENLNDDDFFILFLSHFVCCLLLAINVFLIIPATALTDCWFVVGRCTPGVCVFVCKNLIDIHIFSYYFFFLHGKTKQHIYNR